MMKKLGIVSCDRWKGIIKEDLFLQKELINRGYKVDLISWEDKSINYNDYECLILRSVWGYQNKYPEFKKWLLYLKQHNIKIFNDVDILLNNVRKNIQFQILDEYQIPHIKTTFIKGIEELSKIVVNNEEQSVIKPIISGSGNNTFKLWPSDNLLVDQNEIIKVFEPIFLSEDNGAMVQPYIPEIIDGEYACIFIDGTNTHNMLRYPGVFTEKQRPIYIEIPPKDILELAYKVSRIPEFENYLYMRVDIVYNNGEPTVMEVELAEPDLLIKYIPDSQIQNKIINCFTDAIEGRL